MTTEMCRRCGGCGAISWPVLAVEELVKETELVKERMRSVPNMPKLEEI